eukprot:g3456.t1
MPAGVSEQVNSSKVVQYWPYGSGFEEDGRASALLAAAVAGVGRMNVAECCEDDVPVTLTGAMPPSFSVHSAGRFSPDTTSGRHPRGPDSYSMRYTAACGDRVLGFHNLTVPLEGFWNDSSTPGYHYENYVGARDFGPTMIYDVALGNDGVSYEWCAVYACEGPPVQRKVGYSWQLLSRRRSVPGLQAIVEHWVERARKLGLDLQGLHYANWDDCGSWKDGRNDEG